VDVVDDVETTASVISFFIAAASTFFTRDAPLS
jgi:hypothetical protein